MSLFFLILTIIFYGLCHLVAVKTPVPRGGHAPKVLLIKRKSSEVEKQIYVWAANQKHKTLSSPTHQTYLFEQKPNALSFGIYFHFEIHPQGEDETQVLFSLYPKLIGPGKENHRSLKNLRRILAA